MVWGPGFRVQSSGFRVQGAGCRVQAVGWRVWQDRALARALVEVPRRLAGAVFVEPESAGHRRLLKEYPECLLGAVLEAILWAFMAKR